MIISRFQKEVERKESVLNVLKKKLKTKEAVDFLSPSQIQALLHMIEINIIHDTSVEQNEHSIKQILLCHKIFTNLLFLCDHEKIVTYLQKQFSRNIVEILATPNKEEQDATLKTINAIYGRIPSHRSVILATLVHMICCYISDMITVNCVNPILIFFDTYFRSFQRTISKTFINLFKQNIFPLFNTKDLEVFFENLSKVTVFLCSKDSDLIQWCTTYLMKHWPICNPNKIVDFLKIISQIGIYFNVKTDDTFLSSVLKKISECIRSKNAKISKTALEICGDPNYVELFSDHYDIVVEIIVPAIQDSCNHWSEEICALSKSAMKTMESKNIKIRSFDSGNETSKEEEEEYKKNWEIIFNQAKEFFPNITFADPSAEYACIQQKSCF